MQNSKVTWSFIRLWHKFTLCIYSPVKGFRSGSYCYQCLSLSLKGSNWAWTRATSHLPVGHAVWIDDQAYWYCVHHLSPLCCFVNRALWSNLPAPTPQFILTLCHTIHNVRCQRLAAREWEQQHKSRRQRGHDCRRQSKRKRATFLGPRINSPVATITLWEHSRKPKRTTDKRVTFLTDLVFCLCVWKWTVITQGSRAWPLWKGQLVTPWISCTTSNVKDPTDCLSGFHFLYEDDEVSAVCIVYYCITFPWPAI